MCGNLQEKFHSTPTGDISFMSNAKMSLHLRSFPLHPDSWSRWRQCQRSACSTRLKESCDVRTQIFWSRGVSGPWPSLMWYRLYLAGIDSRYCIGLPICWTFSCWYTLLGRSQLCGIKSWKTTWVCVSQSKWVQKLILEENIYVPWNQVGIIINVRNW